jgi:rhodanese-related sulfurtransferase
VAQQLREHGLEASVLAGGIEAWRKVYPVEAIEVAA